MKNLSTMDRLLRVILAEICIIVAFFWVTEVWQIPLCLIAGVMLLQAGTASCEHLHITRLESVRDRPA